MNPRQSNVAFLRFYPLARAIATNASKLIGSNVQATDRDLTGKVFTSQSHAANEASEFFSRYYGGVYFHSLSNFFNLITFSRARFKSFICNREISDFCCSNVPQISHYIAHFMFYFLVHSASILKQNMCRESNFITTKHDLLLS